MTKKLAGKVALITGGSRGIGAAIARRLALDGADVAITYVSAQQKADEVARGIESAGGRALAIRADSGDVGAVKSAVAETVRTLGRLDVLVNNADPSTLAAQITLLKEQFQVQDVVVVGDRGMVKAKGKAALGEENFKYIENFISCGLARPTQRISGRSPPRDSAAPGNTC